MASRSTNPDSRTDENLAMRGAKRVPQVLVEACGSQTDEQLVMLTAYHVIAFAGHVNLYPQARVR